MSPDDLDGLSREELLNLLDAPDEELRLRIPSVEVGLLLLRRIATESEALVIDAAVRAAVREHGRTVPS